MGGRRQCWLDVDSKEVGAGVRCSLEAEVYSQILSSRLSLDHVVHQATQTGNTLQGSGEAPRPHPRSAPINNSLYNTQFEQELI